MPEQPTIQEVIRGASLVLMEAVLSLIQRDPHQWSARPCQTCQAVSTLAGRPFGCVAKANELRARS